MLRIYFFIGSNGAVRYRIRKDPLGNYKTFKIDPVSGIITLAKGLDRERQKVIIYILLCHHISYVGDIVRVNIKP